MKVFQLMFLIVIASFSSVALSNDYEKGFVEGLKYCTPEKYECRIKYYSAWGDPMPDVVSNGTYIEAIKQLISQCQKVPGKYSSNERSPTNASICLSQVGAADCKKTIDQQDVPDLKPVPPSKVLSTFGKGFNAGKKSCRKTTTSCILSWYSTEDAPMPSIRGTGANEVEAKASIFEICNVQPGKGNAGKCNSLIQSAQCTQEVEAIEVLKPLVSKKKKSTVKVNNSERTSKVIKSTPGKALKGKASGSKQE